MVVFWHFECGRIQYNGAAQPILMKPNNSLEKPTARASFFEGVKQEDVVQTVHLRNFDCEGGF